MGSNIGFEATRTDLGLFANDKLKKRTNVIIDDSGEIKNISELNLKFDQLDDEIELLTNAINSLKITVNDQANDPGIESTLADLLSNYRSTNESFANLQTQVALLGSQITSVKNNDIVVNNTVSSINTKLTQIQTDVNNALLDITSLKNNNASLTTTIAALNGNVNTINISLSKTLADVNTLKSTVAVLVEDNVLQNTDIVSLKAKAIEFKNTVDAMNLTLADMNIKVNNLNNLDISQISADVEHINEIITTLKNTDLAKLTIDLSKNSLEIDSIKTTISSIQSGIVTINSSFTTLKASYDATKLVVDQNISDISKLKTDELKTSDDLKLLSDKYVIDVKKLQDDVALLVTSDININKDIANAHSDIALINDYLTTIKTKIPLMQSEIDALKLVDSNVSNKFITVDATLVDLDTRIKAINLSTIITDIASLKTDNTTIKTDITSLKTDNTTIKTDIDSLKTDNTTIKTSLTNVVTESADNKTKISSIITKNTTIETDLSTIKNDLTLLHSALTNNENIDLSGFTDLGKKITDLQTLVNSNNNSISTTLTTYESRLANLEGNSGTGQPVVKRIDEIIELKDIVKMNRISGKLTSIDYTDGYKTQYFYDMYNNIIKVNYIKDNVTKAYTTYNYIEENLTLVLDSTTFTEMP